MNTSTDDAPISGAVNLDLLTQRLATLLQQKEAERAGLDQQIWGIRGQLELVTQLRGQLIQPPEAPHATSSETIPHAPIDQPALGPQSDRNPRRRRRR